MSTTVLGIDPGNVETAWAWIDAGTCRPLTHGKLPNGEVRAMVRRFATDARPGTIVAVEMVASYGMPVGREVFDTVLQAGRLVEIADPADAGIVRLVYRGDVKVHLCHSKRAKDANVIQALVDRFAPGEGNHGKGTKRAPGWFYGFKADIWQAYALAVYAADTEEFG